MKVLKYDDKEAKSLEKAQKWLNSEFKFIFDGENEYIKNIEYHSSQEGLQNNFDDRLDGDTQKDIDYASRYSALIKKISDAILESVKPNEVVKDDSLFEDLPGILDDIPPTSNC